MSNVKREYPLGHTTTELERLGAQARVFDPWTEALLREAGIGPGMRVLDVGCGRGDVSLMLARLVGPGGHVVAVDRAPEAAAATRDRVARQGLSPSAVQVLTGDVMEQSFDVPFDAVVGRCVLMYFAEPARPLRRLAAHLRPGGVIVFHELDLSTYRALPAAPLFERCMSWIVRAQSGVGTHTQMGLELYAAYCAAGLPAPAMRYDTRVGGGPDFVSHELIADVVRSLLPVIERLGIARREEVDIGTLQDRLREELVANDRVVVLPALIGAWCRLG